MPKHELQQVRDLWDAEAATFDEAADHGLRDDTVRAAWRELLIDALPGSPAHVADLGSGTGTLSLLLAEHGYTVDGVDVSPEMVRLAREKAAGVSGLRFIEADASAPPLQPGAYDAVLCRHVLWAMPDPAAALPRWIDLLTPNGRLLLVEGRWFNGGGTLRGPDRRPGRAGGAPRRADPPAGGCLLGAGDRGRALSRL